MPMSQRLNVLTVTGISLDDQAGGVNTMIRTLSRSLADTCRSVYLEYDWDSPRLSRHEGDIYPRYALRIRAPYVASAPIRNVLAWCITLPVMIRDLRRLLRDEAIDIVHLHYGAVYQYMFRVLRLVSGVPYILTLHRGDIATFPKMSFLDRALMRFTINGADKVVAVSHSLAAEAVAALGVMTNLEVIQNGLDIEELDAIDRPDLDSALGFALPKQFFLMVSNVTI